MIISIPSLLRLRLLSVRPHLNLAEIQLVDDALLYHRLDGRDHVPTEARAVRPSAADWARLRRILQEASFWFWPRRWPRVDDRYAGDFVIAVEWAGRVVVSTGALGVAPEVDRVVAELERLVGRPHAQRAPQATSAHDTPAPQPTYPMITYSAAGAA